MPAGAGAWWDDVGEEDGWSSASDEEDEMYEDGGGGSVRTGSSQTVDMRHLLASGATAPLRAPVRGGAGGGYGRREEEEEEEEAAIMEAIARSLREEEEQATRRGGGCGGGGGGGVMWGVDEGMGGLGGERSIAEVAAIVEARGWMAKLSPTASEVLASMADFDWAAMVWGEDVGMPEADAFLYALEISLDSVRKREASAAHDASSASASSASASPASAAGARASQTFAPAARGGGMSHTGTGVRASAHASQEWRAGGMALRQDGKGEEEGKGEEAGCEWETVLPAARRKAADAPRFFFLICFFFV